MVLKSDNLKIRFTKNTFQNGHVFKKADPLLGEG